jgi:hypothetical protein
VLTASTFEAVVFDGNGAALPGRAADVAAVRSRVEALRAAGVHIVVASSGRVRGIGRPASGPACRPRPTVPLPGPGRR